MRSSRILSALGLLACAVVAPAYADVSVGRPTYPEAQASYPFVVKVRNFNGARGFGFDYFLAPDSLTVVAWNDFSPKRKEVLRVAIDGAEKARWSRFVAEFPVAKLASEYSNRAVSDGLQLWFDFNVPGKPQKQVHVANMGQDDLGRLCEQLNTLLSAPLKLPRLGGPTVGR